MIRRNDGVAFEAAGQSYTLRFDINALCALEDESGVGVNELGSHLSAGRIKLGFVRACFWAGLRHARPDLTVTEAGDVIGAVGIDRAGELLTEAMTAAFPVKDAAAAGGGAAHPPTPPPTGTTS